LQASSSLLHQPPPPSLSVLLLKQRLPQGNCLYYGAAVARPGPLQRSLLQNMAKSNKRQAKANSKLKCEQSGCIGMFGRNSERTRHVKEQHGPPIYCRMNGCDWSNKRLGRLKAHFDKVHCSKGTFKPGLAELFGIPSLIQSAASESGALSSELQTAATESLEPSCE
jgi:hypothetical protein